MQSKTLYEFFNSLGLPLPSVQERRQLWGLGSDYTGTADQNTQILQSLLSGQVSPTGGGEVTNNTPAAEQSYGTYTGDFQGGMPTKSDINPATGQPYAVNPQTGVWDDTYWAEVAEPQLKQAYGQSGDGISSFNFDWGQSEKDALEKLRPYYEEVMAEAEGDVDRAKKIMEEDYTTGKRTRAEDIVSSRQAQGANEKQQKQDFLTTMNQRGLLFGGSGSGGRGAASGFAQRAYTPTSDKQTLRRQAIERALTRSEDIATKQKSRGFEAADIELKRRLRDMEEEKRKRASEMATLKYGRDYDKWAATTSRFIK